MNFVFAAEIKLFYSSAKAVKVAVSFIHCALGFFSSG